MTGGNQPFCRSPDQPVLLRYANSNGRDITSEAIANRAKNSEGYVPISALDLSEVSLVQSAMCGEFALRKAHVSPSFTDAPPKPYQLYFLNWQRVLTLIRIFRNNCTSFVARPDLGWPTRWRSSRLL